jgi:hypothetical protein
MDFIEDTDNDIIRLRTKIKISEFIINISKNKNDNDIYNIIVNNAADIYNDIIYVSGLMVIENNFEADDDIRDYIIYKILWNYRESSDIIFHLTNCIEKFRKNIKYKLKKLENDNEYLKKSLLRFQLITSICAFCYMIIKN